LVVCEAKVFDTFLTIAIDDDDKRALNREVWVATAAMNKELRAPHKNPNDREERLAKSIRVEDLGVAFVDNYTAALGGELSTLYMHHGMGHLPEMILELPIDISDLLQQFVAHAWKEEKGDMHAFSNKRLRDEGNDKGRNLQVMQKGREREYLKRHEEMPLSRNEKRQLGDGSKATEQSVARAARRGQLVSRSQAQLTKRVGKVQSELQKAVALVQERRALQALTADVESPAPNIQASNAPAGSGPLGSGAAGAHDGAGAEALPPTGRGAGRGRGAAAGAAAARGRGAAGRAWGGWGSRGRGRSRPASAQDV
jgi:hypothetical protein